MEQYNYDQFILPILYEYAMILRKSFMKELNKKISLPIAILNYFKP